MLKAVRTMLIVLLNIVFMVWLYLVVPAVPRRLFLCTCEAVGDTSKDLPPDRQKHLLYRRMMVNLKWLSGCQIRIWSVIRRRFMCTHAVDETRGNRHAERYLYAEQQYDLRGYPCNLL